MAKGKDRKSCLGDRKMFSVWWTPWAFDFCLPPREVIHLTAVRSKTGVRLKGSHRFSQKQKGLSGNWICSIKRTKIGSFPIESPWSHDRLDVESLLQHASAMTGTKAPVTTPPFTNRPPRPAGQGPSPGRAVQVSRGGVYRGGPVWSQTWKMEDLGKRWDTQGENYG